MVEGLGGGGAKLSPGATSWAPKLRSVFRGSRAHAGGTIKKNSVQDLISFVILRGFFLSIIQGWQLPPSLVGAPANAENEVSRKYKLNLNWKDKFELGDSLAK